jgi:cell division protein FtsW
VIETRGRADWVLLGAVVALLMLGAEMVYSASFVVAHNEFHDDFYFLGRQVLWIVVGALGMGLVARSDYGRWKPLSPLVMVACLAGLVLILLPGIGVSNYGAQRWLALGPLPPVQPSEFAKLALVLYMSNWLANKGKQVGEFTYGAVPFVIVLGLVAGLVMLEPDLGTTVIIVATAISVFFVAGANLLHFLLGGVLAGFCGVWFVVTESYRMDRVSAFLDPWKDSQGSGWHTIQTLIALGSGGLAGLGLGASRQKFYYVPNAHTDAIFAIIGEELGFLGTVGVLLLFAVIAWRGLLAAARAPDTYGRLLATGATCMLTWQALINIAVTTNSVPYTGVTLPFVSFGGSSIVVSLVAAGIIVSVSRARTRPEAGGAAIPVPGGPERPAPGPRPGLRRRLAVAERPVVGLRSGHLQERRARRAWRTKRVGRA